MDARTAIDESIARAAAPGADLYYATLLLDQDTRTRVRCLHALAQELIDIPRHASDPGIAQIKLAWWQEELGLLREGRGRHPISVALQATAVIPALPVEALSGMVESATRRFDARDCPDMIAAVNAHRGFEGELWRATAVLAGATRAPTLQAAAEMGTAIGIISTLQNLRDHVRAGIARLPADALSTHGLAIDDLGTGTDAGVVSDLATRMAGEARARTLSALSTINDLESDRLLAHLVMTEIAIKTLAEMQADGFALMQRRVSLTPLRKLWTALMVRRRERRRGRHR